MSYRKFNADHLFTGDKILQGEYVLVTDDDGKVLDIIDIKDAGEDVEVFKGMITPGFVNCHCHLELSHLKNVVPAGTGLVEFVQQVMSKRINATEDEKLAVMQQAEQELYDSGTVAVGDICNTTDSIAIKQKSNLQWHNFIEVSGFTDAFAAKRFDAANEIAQEFSKLKANYSVVPHSPYSVSKKLFELINDSTRGQLLSIHNQESQEENELYKNKEGGFLDLYKNFGIDISAFELTGKTSLQSWLPYLNNYQSIISVHNTFIDQPDIDLVDLPSNTVVRQMHFCLCPNANKYIENAMPPIELLRKNDCRIVLGTDSYASNWQLNILEEIKIIQQDKTFSVPLVEILQWATINGAKALQLDKALGSFEKNKQPGIVLINEIEDGNVTERSFANRIL
ncbi:MAG: amidohydrolase family protein [Bacteroidota bacterium]